MKAPFFFWGDVALESEPPNKHTTKFTTPKSTKLRSSAFGYVANILQMNYDAKDPRLLELEKEMEGLGNE
jgi:hypothetical protein